MDKQYPDVLSIMPKKEIILSYTGEYKKIGGSTLNLNIPDLTIGIEDNQLMVFLSELYTFKLFWQDDLYFYQKESISIYKFYKNEKDNTH